MFVTTIIIIILLLKEVGSARLRESDIHPISPKTPAPQYQPIDRKKRKGKIVGIYHDMYDVNHVLISHIRYY